MRLAGTISCRKETRERLVFRRNCLSLFRISAHSTLFLRTKSANSYCVFWLEVLYLKSVSRCIAVRHMLARSGRGGPVALPAPPHRIPGRAFRRESQFATQGHLKDGLENSTTQFCIRLINLWSKLVLFGHDSILWPSWPHFLTSLAEIWHEDSSD